MSLKIDFKWVDAGRSIDELSQATMAELSIVIDGVSITSHVDRRTQLHGDAITVPLYPLAEWLTSWWFPLFSEYGEWEISEEPGFLLRHDLAHAGSGFVYPGLLLRPTGSFLDVRTRRLPRRHSLVEYLGQVVSQVPMSEAKSEFAKLVKAVVERLRLSGHAGSTAQRDWEALGDLKSDELAFCESAGRFGLDPFDMEDEDAEAILRLTSAAPLELREDLFSLGDPQLAESLLGPIEGAAQLAAQAGAGAAWADLVTAGRQVAAATTPWEAGYELARGARERLALDGEPVSFTGDLSVGTVEMAAHARRLIGVVSATSPACAMRAAAPTSRRFAVARAVGDYLMRPAPQRSLLTTMSSDRQARTRSFAAEFLAPSAGIRTRLGSWAGGWIDAEAVDELALEYDVSGFVIAHQIRNHAIGRVEF
jgi:hypothetical protein